MSRIPATPLVPVRLSSCRAVGRLSLLGLCGPLLSACSSAPATAFEADAVSAPSYHELFTEYLAPGTPGHCATSGCHGDPGHNVWLCGDEDTCYQGMLDVGLIDPGNPMQSELADPKHSPLSWVNRSGGNMPLDAQGDNAAGRAAIEAWVAAGAKRN